MKSGIPETERRNPRSRGLDAKSAQQILRIINREDSLVPRAVAREIPAIARAVDAIASRMRRGGRLIYVGAGTSGRLASLDAAECPPTFGVPKSRVVARIAGGRRALTDAVEGAEDSAALGARALAAVKVSAKDSVVGLAASGATPFVLGALSLARRRRALTIAVTANPRSPLARAAQISIVPRTGPEVVTGSTRMKAGTAQKLVLNMLSTAVMARLGRVFDNWMVGVALTNQKLRRRGLRILQEVTGAGTLQAGRTLRQAGYDLPVALVILSAGVSAARARRLLRDAGGSVRRALRRAKARGNS